MKYEYTIVGPSANLPEVLNMLGQDGYKVVHIEKTAIMLMREVEPVYQYTREPARLFDATVGNGWEPMTVEPGDESNNTVWAFRREVKPASK